MGATQYYTATTLDGYIADDHNSLEWLFEVDRDAEEGEHSFAAFFAQVGAMAMGATTYKWVLDHERVLDEPGKWSGWYGETPCWVFTHGTLPTVPGANISFVQGDVPPCTSRWPPLPASRTSGSSAAGSSSVSSRTSSCSTRSSSESHR